MKKILTLFIRDEKTHLVTNQVNPGCEWVLADEGIATKKWDGICCMFKGGKLYKRYDGSKSKILPSDFIPADDAESHWLGWRPVGDGPEDRWHNEALANRNGNPPPDGIYELIGPSVNRNPERATEHCFRLHGDECYLGFPRDFAGIKAIFTGKDIEGVVFHHPDGRMAKIKLRDFGLKRIPSTSAVMA